MWPIVLEKLFEAAVWTAIGLAWHSKPSEAPRIVPEVTVQPHALVMTAPTPLATLQGHCREPLTGPVPGVVWTWTVRNTNVAQAITSTESAVTVVPVADGQTYIVGACSAGDSDSALVTVQTAVCAPTATHMCPGDNVAAKVTAQPSGTAFTFGPGIYPNVTITAKANMTFTGPPYVGGQPAAIFDGGRTLTGFTQSGAVWFIDGQTQNNPDGTSPSCQTGFPACALPEQVWIDGVLQKRELDLASVTTGEWFFDHSIGRIWIGSNPNGKTVVTSVTPHAIGGSVSNVSVSKIKFIHYASARPGAVVNNNKGGGWDLDSLYLDDNGGVSVAITGNASTGPGRMRWNKVFRAGQMGYWCQGLNSLVYGNEFGFNNTAGHGPGGSGEAGAGKCSFSNGLVFRQNNSHDNDGPGIWIDIDNINGIVDSNEVHDNLWRGIFWEISYAAVIRDNNVSGNGFDFPGAVPSACEGGGIIVSNSPNVEVFGNTVEDNFAGIVGREEDRGSGAFGAYHTTNLQVHNNTIRQTSNGRAAGICDTDPGADAYAGASNNDWLNNVYFHESTVRWRWTGNSDISLGAWQAAQDAGSTFNLIP